MPPPKPLLAAPTEIGTLGVYQLKRLWSRLLAARRGAHSTDLADKHRNHLVIDALGLGLEQTLPHLMRTAPTFADFEAWIVATAGGVDPDQVARINAASPEPSR